MQLICRYQGTRICAYKKGRVHMHPDAFALAGMLHECELVRFDPDLGLIWAWDGGYNTCVNLLDLAGNVLDTREVSARNTDEYNWEGLSHDTRLDIVRQCMMAWQAELLHEGGKL